MPQFDRYIDPQKLIAEVKTRPILYNSSLPDNSNKKYKMKMWMEITEVIMDSVWNTMSSGDKYHKCRDIQMKWKYMRDNFRREYVMRKSDKHGAVKKKKYRFYNQMMFLVPFLKQGRVNPLVESDDVKDEQRQASQSMASDNGEVDTFNNDIEYLEVNEPDVSINNQDGLNFEVQPMQGLAEVDEDSAFCVSLIKSLKRMSNADKLSAKIEILNVIRKLSYPYCGGQG